MLATSEPEHPSSHVAPQKAPRDLWSVGRILAVVVVVVLGVISAGCVTVTSSAAGPSSGPASPTVTGAVPSVEATLAPASPTVQPMPSLGDAIGYISLGEQVAFARAVSASVHDEAERRDVELIACDSRLEPEGVRACAEQLGEAGVRGAISFSGFPELGVALCEALHDVPVVGVAYDQGPCQVSMVGTDNHAAGALAGEALGRFSKRRWDCEITAWVSLESSAAGALGSERMDGYRDGYERHCPLPADRSFVLDGTDRVVTAQRQVAQLLADTPGDRILIVGLNEDAVSGALAAAQARWSGGRCLGERTGGRPVGPVVDRLRRPLCRVGRSSSGTVREDPRRDDSSTRSTVDEVPARIDTPIDLVTGSTIRLLYPDIPPCDRGDGGG